MSEDTKNYIDERLEQAIVASKYRITLFTQKNNAKLKFLQASTYAKNGGVFKVDSSLISFVNTLLNQGLTESVLIDSNNSPIFIEDLEAFASDVLDCYAKASNEYLADIKKLQATRKIAPMLGV